METLEKQVKRNLYHLVSCVLGAASQTMFVYFYLFDISPENPRIWSETYFHHLQLHEERFEIDIPYPNSY